MSLSINSRLTLLVSFAISITLIIMLSVMLMIIKSIIFTAGKQFMIDESVVIHDLIAAHPNSLKALDKEIFGVPASLKHKSTSSYRYFLALYDSNKKIIRETPGAPSYIKKDMFPIAKSNKSYSSFNNITTPDDKHYLLFSAPVQFDSYGKPIKSIQMAFDISYAYQLLHHYSKLIIIILVPSLIMIIFIVRLLTKNGLRDLHRTVFEIQKSKNSGITKPINIENWPLELKLFGNRFNKLLNRIDGIFEKLKQTNHGFAHELRTPINNLIVQTEVILLKDRAIEDYKKLLYDNLENYHRLSRIINSILMLSQYENPSTKLHKQNIDVNKITRKICQDYNKIIEDKQLEFSISGNATLYADPTMLECSIRNIVINAIKYNKFKGDILIKIHKGEKIIIEVEDSGIGIPDELIENICKPYYQVNDENQTYIESHYHHSGIGLGLAITKSILLLHKGKISIKSKLGEWTNIKLTFPNAVTKN